MRRGLGRAGPGKQHEVDVEKDVTIACVVVEVEGPSEAEDGVGDDLAGVNHSALSVYSRSLEFLTFLSSRIPLLIADSHIFHYQDESK